MVLQEKVRPTAVVIGTIFVDCKGFAADGYHPQGRNVGRIGFVHGGVGRNVAQNMAGLSVDTSLIATVQGNGIGLEVLQRLNECGVNTDLIFRTGAGGTGMWLAILDTDGNLLGSVSQMPDIALLEQAVSVALDKLSGQQLPFVLEVDLSETVSKQTLAASKKSGCPVYGLPGNLSVIGQHPEWLSDLDLFICNDFEACRLAGRAQSSLAVEEAQQLGNALVEKYHCRGLVITLGERGAVFFENGQVGHQPAETVQLIDSTGAGDAFFSGTVMGLLYGQSLGTAVLLGTKTAAWTIAEKESNCSTLAAKMNADSVFQAVLRAHR